MVLQAAGHLFVVSPADETPVDPHDAYAEELTPAEGIDRFQQAVAIKVRDVSRTFVAEGLVLAEISPQRFASPK